MGSNAISTHLLKALTAADIALGQVHEYARRTV